MRWMDPHFFGPGRYREGERMGDTVTVLEPYKGLICKVLELAEEAAKLTGQTWDDAVAQMAHEVICRWLGTLHEAKANGYQASAMAHRLGFSSQEAVAVPDWLKKLLLALAQLLPALL